MPSRWNLHFHIPQPEKVKPQHFAAVISTWLENNQQHHAPRKAFTISPMRDLEPEAVGVLAIDIGLVDDRLAEPLLIGAGQAARTGIRLGQQKASLIPSRTGRVAHLESAADWAELREGPISRGRITIELLTPTFFRSGQRHLPFPQPGLIFGHLREQWTLWSGTPHQEPSLETCPISISDFELKCTQVPLRHGLAPGTTGTISYQINRASALPDITRWLSLLPYTALGSETRLGYGQARHRHG